VGITQSGIKGLHHDPAEDSLVEDKSAGKSPRKPSPDPNTVMCMWLPASIIHQVHPGLVDDFECDREEENQGF